VGDKVRTNNAVKKINISTNFRKWVSDDGQCVRWCFEGFLVDKFLKSKVCFRDILPPRLKTTVVVFNVPSYRVPP
jgi:hypothetical protein